MEDETYKSKQAQETPTDTLLNFSCVPTFPLPKFPLWITHNFKLCHTLSRRTNNIQFPNKTVEQICAKFNFVFFGGKLQIPPLRYLTNTFESLRFEKLHPTP